MKIKVNKNQWVDDYERESLRRSNRYADITSSSLGIDNFTVEDVTPEQLMDYIEKGYGIRINC